jgi:hypothetical protein
LVVVAAALRFTASTTALVGRIRPLGLRTFCRCNGSGRKFESLWGHFKHNGRGFARGLMR